MDDGLSRSPPPSSSLCAVCSKAESKVEALLDQISRSFSEDPSKFLGFDLPPPPPPPSSDPIDCSDLFRRWLQNFDSPCSEYPLCPDLRKQIEVLVLRLLREKLTMGSISGRRKRARDDDDGDDDRELGLLVEMLNLLRDVALDPCDDLINSEKEWKGRIYKARKAMFVRANDVPDPEEFPYRRKQQKTHKFLSATNGDLHFCRRSQRTVLKLGNSELPRKRIPIGTTFQVDVPQWTGPPNKKDMYISKWLGTKVWPIKDDARKIKREMLGNGRLYSCNCNSPASVECVRYHVKMARLRLKSELGPAFLSLGFAEMGEEICKSWTQEEQLKFDDIVRQNPSSDGKSFLEPALKHFTSKSRKDIVSYYFNVFLLRWMSLRTRLEACAVDTSDDESFGCDDQKSHIVNQIF